MSEEVPFLEVKNVRITPGRMVFEDAYEGKVISKKLEIQNCGTKLVNVRLYDANSSTFKFKSFAEGMLLSPGMKIVRIIKYKYTYIMGLLEGFTQIFVDTEEVVYKFFVTLSQAIIEIQPTELDFGSIDAVNGVSTRTFFIKNVGCKGTHFSIDLGRNALDLLVEPIKGNLPAKSSIPVKVEIVGIEEGDFLEEIWIKGDPPQRVLITGTFISPKVLVKKFIYSLNFTLLEYPPTYYGSHSNQTLILKNFSSSHSMFCVMAEIKGTTMTLDEAREQDDMFKNFIIQPLDGRMAAHKAAIIQITFAPVTLRQDYSVCFLKLCRLDCRDVDTPIYECIQQDTSPQMGDASSIITTPSEHIPRFHASRSMIDITPEPLGPEASLTFVKSIGICLYGEKVKSQVVVTPDMLKLSELTLNQVYYRVLLFENQCKLPIKIRYDKMALVDVEPEEFDLKAFETKEIQLKVRTSQMNQIEKHIVFILLARDSPYEKCVLRKVGSRKVKLVLDTCNVLQKGKYQCAPCTDLTLKLPYDSPYRLSSLEMMRRSENKEYYRNYIRSLKKPIPQLDSNRQDYQISGQIMLKTHDLACSKLVDKNKELAPYRQFIPLPPTLLYNVKIIPKSIKLQKVAAYTTILDYFEITNLNIFPIKMFVSASKSCIAFERQHYIISAQEKAKIYFTFSNTKVGRYYLDIKILINSSTLFVLTAVAHIVPKTLRLESNIVKIEPQDENYKIFKVLNTLNSFASYEWEVPEGCFEIYPQEGGIRAESFIYCMVQYNQDPTLLVPSECVLTSESGQRRILSLVAKRRPHHVVFDKYEIDFGVVPLNMPVRKKVILKNTKRYQVTYQVLTTSPLPGIEIVPIEGTLGGLDSQVFKINVLFRAVFDFLTDIVFLIDNEEEMKVVIKGTVEYPDVQIHPNILNFRKISPFSFDVLAFKMRNLSQCEAHLRFPIDETPEFIVTMEEEQLEHLETLLLAPQSSKVLFLHFRPTYVTTYSFFLLYIINDILGPVYINSNMTHFPIHYLEEFTGKYETSAVSFKTLPRNLSTMRVNCNATENMIELSSTLLTFFYYGEDNPHNNTTQILEITNISNDVIEACIRIDDLIEPFSMSPVEDDNVIYCTASYRFSLINGEKVQFKIDFMPQNSGEFFIKLPIFLRHYYDDKIFNYLVLKGNYCTPTMIPSSSICHFEPTPLGIANELKLTLIMKNHFHDCLINSESEIDALSVTFEKNETLVTVILCYQPRTTSCLDSQIIFYCSCGAATPVKVYGVAENCLLTTYSFSNFLTGDVAKISDMRKARPRMIPPVVNKNSTSFPLFPCQNDKSIYAQYMRKLKASVEDWLFTQIFYRKGYYRIPDGFSDFCKVTGDKKARKFGTVKKEECVDLPILTLIQNIAGKQKRKELEATYPKEDTDLAWLSYISKTTSNILAFLRNFYVFVPHIKTSFLLNYDHYVLYQKIKHPSEVLLAETAFIRLSTQSWLDLLLQIIKTFFLFRTMKVDNLQEKVVSLVGYRSTQGLSKNSLEEEEMESVLQIGIYGPSERILLEWLMECYNQEKNTLWGVVPVEREIVFLDEDLRDGLILGAVTAHYCPYLKQELKYMYGNPHTLDECFHNACVLTNCWKMLKLSYFVTPLTFTAYGLVRMLLLVSYLYEVLPNYTPREKICIEAPLTRTSTAVIDLENLGEDGILYTVIFFNNDNLLFNIEKETIFVERRKSKKVKLTYHAKSHSAANSTIIFSGETIGHKYGKSVVISLKGKADLSYSSMVIPLNIQLYKTCQVTIDAQSPFKLQAPYYLLVGKMSKESETLIPWKDSRNWRCVWELVFENDIYEFDENGKCLMSNIFCIQEIGPRDIKLCFSNLDIGDWVIQLSITGKVSKECYEKINIEIPDDYDDLVCHCMNRISCITNCPKVLYLSIPKINNLLWNARKEMVLRFVDKEEFDFWSERIYTRTGTRILRLLLNSECHPFSQFLEETVEYEPIFSKKSAIVSKEKIVIDDITSDDFFTLPVHPIEALGEQKKVVMKLRSLDHKETRFYKLNFCKKPNEE